MKAAKVLVAGILIALALVLIGGCSSGDTPQDEALASPTASPPDPSPAAPTGGVTVVNQDPSGSSSPTPAAPNDGMTRSNTGGKVTIDMEWLGLENGVLNFKVAMNTHSVELDGYNLGNLTVLRDDMGNEYAPVSWDSGPGGHHRRGTLTFPVPDSIKQRETAYLEIIIRDVAGIDKRTLTWMME